MTRLAASPLCLCEHPESLHAATEERLCMVEHCDCARYEPAPRARATLDRSLSEAAWQRTVIEAAEALGYLVYHTYDSRRSQAGFPDLILTHPSGGPVICAELKTEMGRVRPEQQQWLDALDGRQAVGMIWRPSDWAYIECVLRRKK